MGEQLERDLIYDWNVKGRTTSYPEDVLITDETLRDGLQAPSISRPSLEEQLRLVHLMADLGVDAADLGLCGAGSRFADEVTLLAREIADHGLGIQPQSAARTMISDVEPIVEASDRAGIAIETCVFIGSSPIRQYAEGWTLDQLLRLSEESVRYAVDHGLPVMYVTEDTTRAHPEALRRLYTVGIEAGAKRICLSDTVGHATPDGVHNLVTFVKSVVEESGEEVGIDWHGHRDRGLSIINTLAAIAAGATRVHGCALGIGERSGNTPLELLLVNLNLLGIAERDLTRLPEYCQLVSETCHAPLPFNYPVVGADAFRTATGVHAAAVVKALSKGDEWLADRVYCGVPASMVGRAQGIEIGPMSGASNVRFYLQSRGIEAPTEAVDRILQAAKAANTLLPEEEVLGMLEEAA